MASLPHLLIVDDDPDIRQLVRQYLERNGFRVTATADGNAMRQVLAGGVVDLIILDLMLPEDDGLTLCRELRSASKIPVIFLTAVGSETDRIVGLELGADDYLTKPFSARELLARIRAVLRRTSSRGDHQEAQIQQPHGRGSILRFSGWTLDTAHRQLHSPDGVLVELSGGEYELLSVFLKNPQIVLNRDQLLDATRGRLAGPYDRSIDVQVGRLRRKIELDPKNPELVKTIRSGGYVLATDVETS